MEKNIKEINSCTREIIISLTADELKPHFDEAYKKAQGTIDLKGFRKGKVPLNMIKQHYGKRIENDAFDEISTEIFNEYMKENEIRVIGQPGLIDIVRADGGVKFTIRYEVIPDFELKNYKELQVDEPVHSVTEEEIEEQISQICINGGRLEPHDEIVDDSYVAKLKLSEIDNASLLPILGTKPLDTSVYLSDKALSPHLKSSLLNKKVGDTFNFQPEPMENQGPPKTFKVEIAEISKLIPAKLTNEFVEQQTAGKLVSTEEFREEIGFRMQQEWDGRSRQHVETQIVEKLVDMHEFDVPETVVTNVIASMIEDLKKRYENTPQAAEAAKMKYDDMAPGLRPVAERSVKWEIIKSKIAKEEKIEIEDYDIDPLVDQQAEEYKVDKETIRKYLVNNENFVNRLLNDKIMNFLIDFAVTNEISFDDIVHNHDHEFEDSHDHDHEHSHDHHDHEHGHDHDHHHHDHKH